MNVSNLKQKLILLLPLLTCFDSYCFFYISTLPITLSFLGICFALALGLLEAVNKKISFQTLGMMVFLLVLLLLSVITSGNLNVNSSALYILYFFSFFFSEFTLDVSQRKKINKITLWVINLFSVIALFQFLSNFLPIPRIDIVLEGHMVTGFNRTNAVYLGNFVFLRSNAFYLEPSALSQYCVFGIILAYMRFKEKDITRRRLILFILLNLSALITSVAGTGVLVSVFVFGIAYFSFLLKRYMPLQIINRLLLFLLGGLCLFLILPSNLRQYILQRLFEIVNPQLSGGMRFSYPYIIMGKSFLTWPFGISPGCEELAILRFYPQMGQLVLSSGYAKMGVELGLLGFLFLFYIQFKTRKKDNLLLFLFIIILNFVGGNLLQPYFWAFLLYNNYKTAELPESSFLEKTNTIS